MAAPSMWETDPALEIALLRAISFYPPIGYNRHFNMVSILGALQAAQLEVPSDAPGSNRHAPLSAKSVWQHLETLYDLEGLNELDDGSEDEEAPEWMQHYDQHAALLARNEKARTRVLDNVDAEEFALHPVELYAPFIEQRRIARDLSEEVSAPATRAAEDLVVPASSDEDISDANSSDEHVRGGGQGAHARSRSQDTRRLSRKRADDEHSQEVPPSSPDSMSTRAGKRRKSMRTAEHDDPADKASRPISTRRQRQTDGDGSKRATTEDFTDSDDGTTDEKASLMMRSARNTPARRSVGQIATTPNEARPAQTRAFSAATRAASSTPRASPVAPARSSRRR
ncbi:hypothetical protein MVES1_002140 [Malassezia vespertilionis]|uniref:Chromatin modification-related protein EAF7 n=1 Tax=Malassezia vespertilionis TaxID=2020962 RepID=A0A2N1JC90_9BASI|nr:uncharacterized protein MVES1_002140 [Malassezia vespertilionis]PKI84156.1 hypothetical protein MVES_002018 [Malassezia vespertilionis]WFD06786.1 hypothetical protein MVES1_002140 [Malassezia vespertilionis]